MDSLAHGQPVPSAAALRISCGPAWIQPGPVRIFQQRGCCRSGASAGLRCFRRPAADPVRPGPPAARLPPEAKRRSETLYAPVLYNLKGYNITRARVYYIQDIYYRARKGVSFRFRRCGSPAAWPTCGGVAAGAAAGLRCCPAADPLRPGLVLLDLPGLHILPGSPYGAGLFFIGRSRSPVGRHLSRVRIMRMYIPNCRRK